MAGVEFVLPAPVAVEPGEKIGVHAGTGPRGWTVAFIVENGGGVRQGGRGCRANPFKRDRARVGFGRKGVAGRRMCGLVRSGWVVRRSGNAPNTDILGAE